MTTTKKAEVPVIETVETEGVQAIVNAAADGEVVLRHPRLHDVFQTVSASAVGGWTAQGWLVLGK